MIGPEVFFTVAITELTNMEAVRPKSKSKSKKKASRVSQEGMLGRRGECVLLVCLAGPPFLECGLRADIP